MRERIDREDCDSLIMTAMKLGHYKADSEEELAARLGFYWGILKNECDAVQLSNALNEHLKHVSKFMPEPFEIMQQLKNLKAAARWRPAPAAAALPEARPAPGEFPLRKWLRMTDDDLRAQGLSEEAIRFVRGWGESLAKGAGEMDARSLEGVRERIRERYKGRDMAALGPSASEGLMSRRDAQKTLRRMR